MSAAEQFSISGTPLDRRGIQYMASVIVNGLGLKTRVGGQAVWINLMPQDW